GAVVTEDGERVAAVGGEARHVYLKCRDATVVADRGRRERVGDAGGEAGGDAEADRLGRPRGEGARDGRDGVVAGRGERGGRGDMDGERAGGRAGVRVDGAVADHRVPVREVTRREVVGEDDDVARVAHLDLGDVVDLAGEVVGEAAADLDV